MAELIVALDVSTVARAREINDSLPIGWRKIGCELYAAYGVADFAARIKSEGGNVFLDLKLADIPTTNAKTIKSILRHMPAVDIISVRTGYHEAVEAAGGQVKIVHVPALTSDDLVDPVPSEADMVVCRPQHAVRYEAITICPGFRLKGDATDDHKQPTDVAGFADYVVVGRPITQAQNARDAYQRYVEQI